MIMVRLLCHKTIGKRFDGRISVIERSYLPVAMSYHRHGGRELRTKPMFETYSIAQDLKEAQAMTDSLESYLKQDQLYGSVGGGFFTAGRMPALTVGALVTRLRRLHLFTAQMNDEQLAQLGKIDSAHEAVRRDWRHHYEAKLKREAKSRLDAMRPFFEEAKDLQQAAKIYGPEVLRRTITEECLTALEDLNVDTTDLRKLARATDSRLRSYVSSAGFFWDDKLQEAYPMPKFWWLYSAPAVPERG